MSGIAVKPGASKLLVQGTTYTSRRWAQLKKANPHHYSWSGPMMVFVWKRIPIIIAALVLPVSLIAITLWTLLGYLWLLYFPVAAMYRKAKSSSRYTDVQAYKAFSKLKDQWREHGVVFYRQVWDHTCSGNKTEWRKYGDRSLYTDCGYCDKRLKELFLLVQSQESVESEIDETVTDSLFDASRAFRIAVEEGREAALRKDKFLQDIAQSASKIR